MNTFFARIHWVLKGQDGTSATIQTFLSRILILATNVATGVITARFLGSQGRGEQTAIILWPQFLAFSLTFGLPSALVYNLKRYPESKSKLFSASLFLATILGFVAMMVGVVFIPFWLSNYSIYVIRDAQWMMLATPLVLLGVIFTAALESEGKFGIANQSRNFLPLATLGLLGGMAITQTLTPLTSGLAYVLPSLPISVWIFMYLWQLLKPQWKELNISCRQLLSYGVRSYGIDLLGTLAGQLDQVLVIGLLSPSSMGMYAVALSLSRMLNVFQASIVTVLFPKIAAMPLVEVVSLTGQVTRLNLFLTLLIGIILMALGPIVLQVLYGSEFMEAVAVFRILIIEVILAGTTMILAQAFMALGRPGMVTILQGVGLGLSLPLMLILIPRYGLVGAGLSLLGSTTARLIFILLSYRITFKIPPPSLVFTSADLMLLKNGFLKIT
jgi:O-antigen/teichoic acid export membrane protein